MNQSSTEPEYTLEILEEKDQPQETGLILNRNFQEVVADLVELSQLATELLGISRKIGTRTQLLVASLREQG